MKRKREIKQKKRFFTLMLLCFVVGFVSSCARKGALMEPEDYDREKALSNNQISEKEKIKADDKAFFLDKIL